MIKQITLTWDDQCTDESNEVTMHSFGNSKLETFEVLFGSIAGACKEVLEDFNKVGYIENLQGEEKVIYDSCRTVVMAYLGHVKKLRNIEDEYDHRI